MRAAAESLEAVIHIGGTSTTDLAAAEAHIVAVDPPSEGIPMQQLRKLQLDVSLADIAVHFGGNSMVCFPFELMLIECLRQFPTDFN